MKQPDAKDQEILAILSKEARIPLKALAARVGLSRSAASERVAQLERAGVIRYLSKPFNDRELLACIRFALEYPHANASRS